MAELKTKVNDQDVNAFLQSVPENRRQDCYTVLEMMKTATGAEPKMWGDAIIGFGSYHYKYASGREGDMPLAGFSLILTRPARIQDLFTIVIML